MSFSFKIRIIKYLVSKDMVDLEAQDKLGKNALMVACMLGYKNTVCLLLDEYQMDPFNVDSTGQTCLMLACENGYENVVKLLLDHVKQSNGYEKLIKFLDAQNKQGETSFSIALKNGQVDCANVLSEYYKWASSEGKQLNDNYSYDCTTADKSNKNNSMANNVNNQVQIKFPLQLEIPTNEFGRPRTSSSASSSLISTDRSSVPDFNKLTDYFNNDTKSRQMSNSLSYSDLNPRLAHAAANISIQVGVNFAAPASPATADHGEDGVFRYDSAYHKPGPVVQNMIRENQNVRRHHKVQRLFRVDSGGRSSTDDAISSPEITGSPNLANRVKRLFDRRMQYAARQCKTGRFSYDPAMKSESSSEGDADCKDKALNNAFKTRRSKSSTSSKGKVAATNDKFHLPPIKVQRNNICK